MSISGFNCLIGNLKISVYLSVSFFCLSGSLFIWFSVYLVLCLSWSLSIWFSVYLVLCLSGSLSIGFSVYLVLCLSGSLSIWFSVYLVPCVCHCLSLFLSLSLSLPLFLSLTYIITKVFPCIFLSSLNVYIRVKPGTSTLALTWTEVFIYQISDVISYIKFGENRPAGNRIVYFPDIRLKPSL